MSKKEIKVPFNRDGNHVTYYEAHEWYGMKQVDNYEFEATLKYVDYERGRSALNIVWEDIHTGIQYRSGMTFLHELLLEGFNINVAGKFTFRKQGTSVLLTRVYTI